MKKLILRIQWFVVFASASLIASADEYWDLIQKVERHMDSTYSGIALDVAKNKLRTLLLNENLTEEQKKAELKKLLPRKDEDILYISDVSWEIVDYSVSFKIDSKEVEIEENENTSFEDTEKLSTNTITKESRTNFGRGAKIETSAGGGRWIPRVNLSGRAEAGFSSSNAKSHQSLASVKKKISALEKRLSTTSAQKYDLSFYCNVRLKNNTKENLILSNSDSLIFKFSDRIFHAERIEPKLQKSVGIVSLNAERETIFLYKIALNRTDLLSIREYVERGVRPSVGILESNAVISDSVGNDLLRKIKNDRENLIEISFADDNNNERSFNFYAKESLSLHDCFSALKSKTEEPFCEFGKNGEVYIYDKKIDYASDAKNFVQVILNGKTLDNEKDVTADLKLKKGDKLSFILNPRDVETLKKYANDKNPSVYLEIGILYLEGERVKQNDAEAVKWFRKAAEQGDVEAQTILGACYYSGSGVEQDYAKAVEWCRKAAEQGLAAAQNMLGDCYYYGNGVEQDYAKAVEWYRKAAEQGLAIAQGNLGYCYYYGNGVEQDYAKAVEWYRKAAEQGLAIAQGNLGYCYYYGNGVEQDYAKALEWYRKAAEQGDVEAQTILGACYYSGSGVEQDYAKAVEWCRKAAEQGLAAAQNMLGDCYYYGRGVEKDYAKAAEWWSKAAAQDHAEAQYELGYLYHRGYGVEKNEARARELVQKSAVQGFQRAKDRLNNWWW